MIRFGLKLWTNNVSDFSEALTGYQQQKFDFLELYHNQEIPLDFTALKILKPMPIEIHNSHREGMHTFIIGEAELKIWKNTLALADFFASRYIVIHAGQKHNFTGFWENLKKIDDPRILVENSPAIDSFGLVMFGQKYADLKKIREIKEICLDIPKAASAAKAQNLPYQEYLDWCMRELKPKYFHLSGRAVSGPNDQLWEHGNLWDDQEIDWRWVKNLIQTSLKNSDETADCVFETPKLNQSLENDFQNMDYFRRA
jgi:hypothetical protein